MSYICCTDLVIETSPKSQVNALRIIYDGRASKVKTFDKECLFGTILFEITGFTTESFFQEGTMPGSIIGSSTKVKCNGQPAILEGDHTTINLVGTTPLDQPMSLPVVVSVKQAGQNKIKAK